MRRLLSIFRVNWAGVAAGTTAAYLAGLAWYGLLFHYGWRVWGEGSSPVSAATAALGIVVVSVLGLDWVIRRTGSLGWISGARVGLATAVFFGLTTTLKDLLCGFKPLEIILIDAGFILVWFGLAGCMVGGLQRRSRPDPIASPAV